MLSLPLAKELLRPIELTCSVTPYTGKVQTETSDEVEPAIDMKQALSSTRKLMLTKPRAAKPTAYAQTFTSHACGPPPWYTHRAGTVCQLAVGGRWNAT